MSPSLSLSCFLAAVLCLHAGSGATDLFQFDIEDILNEKFMPAHLLLQEMEAFLKGSSNLTREQFYNQVQKQSNFTAAFSTMGFHRKMMNEYLATNFLAKQILAELPLNYAPSIDKRIGAVSVNSTVESTKVDTNQRKGKYIPNEMLDDLGSRGYRSWLDKTTTFDDIQRQLSENNDAAVSDFKPMQHDAVSRRKSVEAEDDGVEEVDFDEGDITGYAYSGGPMDATTMYPHHLPFDAAASVQNMQPLYPTAGSKNGYYPPSGHENTYSENYGPVHHVQSQPSHSVKEIGLKDILDIALTTLAFLSFGMFILQVLMCITMEDTSSMMMMPMEASDTGGMLPGGNDASTEEIRRRKRQSPVNRRMEMMNELSRRVLSSIDAVLLIPKDNGSCHYQSLCENNKFARRQKDGQKIWLPMWSLGVSWLSSRVIIANATTGNPVLESLRAAVIGLGDGDCMKTYRSCQLEIIADERQKLEKEINAGGKNQFEWGV